MDDIQDLINIASESLFKLEERIRLDFQTPEQNIKPEDYLLINLPDNYIRRAEYFRESFKLKELIDDKDARDNIAYSLQLSDLNNYFINRFNLFWSVGVLFRKQALINIISIQEGMMKCTYDSLRQHCLNTDGTVCELNVGCDFYLKNLNKIRNNGLLEAYQKVIGFYDEELFKMLKEQKIVRDKIHIHVVDENEFKEDKNYTIEKYNEAVTVLKFLKEFLPNAISDFKNRRKQGCKKSVYNTL